MDASRDQNFVTTLLAVSSVDGVTPVTLYANPTTHRLLVDLSGGGTVTSVSVVSANGFAGTVATATSTPAITLATTVTGILKGNGTAISAAGASDVDSILPTQTGNNGKYLTTNGTVSSWATVAGGGDVVKVGTPVNNQIGVWTGDGTIEGDAALTFDTTTDTITLGVEASTGTITAATAVSANTDGGALYLSGGSGLGSGEGGAVTITGATGGVTGFGGSFALAGGPGGATSGGGGSAEFLGGNAVDGNGGNIFFSAGAGGGSGVDGQIILGNPTSGIAAILDNDSLTTSDKTFTFPDLSGTFAVLAQDANFNTLTVNTNLVPDANDGAALGAAATAFADLFLATGALIGFGNGNAVITHSSGILTVSTGDLRVTTAGTNTASVVTIGGTQTLNAKTFTSPTITTATLSGAQVLAESASIQLDPSLSADGTWSGITITGTAGYTQAFGDLVYLDPTDSRWEAADANAASGADGDARGMLAMVVVAGTDGTACTLLLQGNIRADAKFATFTVNNPLYVSETAGAITQTQPTTTDVVIRVVGAALTADSIYFNPDFFYITHT